MKKPLPLYIASLLLFGTNGIVAAAIPLESAQIVMMRTLIGGLLLAVILAVSHREPAHSASRRQLLFVVASGVCTGFSWVTLYEAYRLVGVGISSLEYYCAPIVVMLASVPLFGERLTTPKVTGFAVVLTGTLLVSGQSLAGGGNAWGLFLGALSALCHAGMVICSKKAPDVSGLKSSTIQLGLSCAIAAVFVAATSGFDFVTLIPQSAWAPIVFLGIANTGLGCLMYFTTILKLPAQTVSVFGYLEPLSAVVFAVILLGEPLSALQCLGAAMILGGAFVSELHFGKVLNPSRS